MFLLNFINIILNNFYSLKFYNFFIILIKLKERNYLNYKSLIVPLLI
jgi:hypothetical protein